MGAVRGGAEPEPQADAGGPGGGGGGAGAAAAPGGWRARGAPGPWGSFLIAVGPHLWPPGPDTPALEARPESVDRVLPASRRASPGTEMVEFRQWPAFVHVEV